jgi:metallo-beta-lactamase class B
MYFGLLAKLERYPKEGPAVFVDPAGYKKFVDDAEASFKKELAAQQQAATARQ